MRRYVTYPGPARSAHEPTQALTPDELIDNVGLIGDEARMRDRLAAYAAAGIDIFSIAPSGRSLDEKLHVVRTVASAASAPSR